jgi:hypothetical protein
MAGLVIIVLDRGSICYDILPDNDTARDHNHDLNPALPLDPTLRAGPLLLHCLLLGASS